MKLSTWAKSQGIHYMTAYRWFLTNKLPVPAYQTPSGAILVQNEQLSNTHETKTYIYCRVSSYEKKDDLERQVQRCQAFCESNGWSIENTFKEVASGMNDNRKKLTQLINSNPTRIVIENKDRLTRFGFNYFEIFLKKLNCEIVVINKEETKENDLMKDLIFYHH